MRFCQPAPFQLDLERLAGGYSLYVELQCLKNADVTRYGQILCQSYLHAHPAARIGNIIRDAQTTARGAGEGIGIPRNGQKAAAARVQRVIRASQAVRAGIVVKTVNERGHRHN